MTGTLSATAAGYFSRVSKARVLEAVTEAAGAEEAGRIAGMKKADMAEEAHAESAPPSEDDAYPFAAE